MSNVRMYCRHDVADYAVWKKGYDDFANYQKTHGVIHESVYQSTDNPNDITVIHDFNNTAMGWSIPATLASLLVSRERKTVCLVGDGSLMMALNDLPTISNSGAPVIIFLLNNDDIFL